VICELSIVQIEIINLFRCLGNMQHYKYLLHIFHFKWSETGKNIIELKLLKRMFMHVYAYASGYLVDNGIQI